MLTQSFTHKSHKITTLTTTTDSYKQLFVLIAMLLTVLSVRPTTFAMAAPLDQPHQYRLTQPQLQQQHYLPSNIIQHHYSNHHHSTTDDHHSLPHLKTKLHENFLAEKLLKYDHHLETDLNLNRENVEDEGNEEERLHKRGVSWNDSYNSIMQSQAINWYNPCGGYLNDQAIAKRSPVKKELQSLQKTISKNYKEMRNELKAINIRNMKAWNYDEKYSFLPKFNNSSSISLRRWHGQLQIYVAAFDYLRRAQLHFDFVRGNQESDYTKELYKLMKNAQVILCNIEHAINNTTSRKKIPNIHSIFINRPRMEEILNFNTNVKYVSPLRWQQIDTNDKKWFVDQLDLRFTKHHYYGFMRQLMKFLRMQLKKPDPIYLGKRRQQQMRTQQKKQQQQQRIQNRNNKNKKQNRSENRKIRHSKKKLE